MIPRLTTERLVLDALAIEDVPALVELAGHPEIYATTLNIPHPYTVEDAQRWIAGRLPGFLNGEGVTFAVRHEGRLVGSVGLIVTRRHDRADLGYWIGRPYWGRGFATEAVRAAAAFGFQHFRLEKIIANHFAGNPGSGRVMEKIGMTREGLHPRHVKKDGIYLDLVTYGLTRAGTHAAALAIESSSTVGTSAGVPGHVARGLAAGEPPTEEELVAPGIGAIERSLLVRHFVGRNTDEIEAELRVYGKSLAPDFARMSPGALGYYLAAAQAYLDSEFAESDWDFAHGIVSALAAQADGGALPKEIRARVRDLVRHVQKNAARYLIEADKQPFAGWVAQTLAD